MAAPLGTIAAAILGGVLVKMGWDRLIAKPSLLGNLPGGTPAAQTTVLTPGQTYAADMLIDSAAFPTLDPQNNAQTIADGFKQVGAEAVSPPQPRDAVDTAKFQNRQPSRWVMLFHWNGPGAFPGALPGYVK